MESISLREEIEAVLGAYHDPYLQQTWGEAKVIKRIDIDRHQVVIEILLGYPFETIRQELTDAVISRVQSLVGTHSVQLLLYSKIVAHASQPGMPNLPQVKNIIAVASGKGGVGKSTVAVNVALALAQEGAQVGLLDADIYGPSQPTMLNAQGEKPVLNDGKLMPIIRYGMQSMSIGYLVDEYAPMVWRGPMIGKAMQQLLHDTNWQALDYLVVDLPPGTGDIQLTLCQKIPVSGAVIVTTPQDLALIDVRRACEMFMKLNVPLIGIVENMSTHICARCGHQEEIFGAGGGEKLAEKYVLPLLAKLPLALSIREMTDSGHPPVVQAARGEAAKEFFVLARKIAGKLATQGKNYAAKFPKIVVEPK